MLQETQRAAEGASPAVRIRSHPERTVPDERAEILATGLVVHVGFVEHGQPYVIPMTYHFDPANPRMLYLHGSHQGRLMRHLATGARVCLSVTLVDGLVYSRTALFHSVNYRSVVCFARAAPTPDRAAQRSILEAMISRYFRGRTAGRDYESPPVEHLNATAFIALEIEAWSAKARRGGPKGPRDGEHEAPGNAGVVPLHLGE